MSGNQLQLTEFSTNTQTNTDSTETDEENNTTTNTNNRTTHELQIDIDDDDTTCTNCGSAVSENSLRVFYPSDIADQDEVDVCPNCSARYKNENAPWISEGFNV